MAVRRSRSTTSPASRARAALKVVVRDGAVQSAELSIFEPPRFFEAFLRGRAFTEAPDITARICGICPVAYQMSAVHAMEDALGVTVGGPAARAAPAPLLRRVDREPRAAHLHAARARLPRLSRARSRWRATMAMSVRAASRSRRPATRSCRCSAGARSIRSTCASAASTGRRAGASFTPLAEQLKWARDARSRRCAGRRASIFPTASATTSSWRSGIPANIRSTRAASSRTAGSTSRRGLRRAFRGNPRRALDRAALAHSRRRRLSRRPARPLQPELRPALAARARSGARGRAWPDLQQSVSEHRRARGRGALRLRRGAPDHRRLRGAGPPGRRDRRRGPASATPATEAPRGLLYHRYRLDDDGTIADARIVPPTSQNQASIEEDLDGFHRRLPRPARRRLRHRCEQTVRNYDPCISCATHFLRSKWIESND